MCALFRGLGFWVYGMRGLGIRVYGFGFGDGLWVYVGGSRLVGLGCISDDILNIFSASILSTVRTNIPILVPITPCSL